MASVSRRTVLQTLGGAGVAAASGAAAAALTGSASAGGHAADPVLTFVSMPDFFNGDVADLSVLPTWDGGMNSVNRSWYDAVDRCLGAVAAHEPDAVLLAGDMVEGRWNIDSDDRQLFGRVDQRHRPRERRTVPSGDHDRRRCPLLLRRRLVLRTASRCTRRVGDHELLDDRPGPLNDPLEPERLPRHGLPDNRYYLVDHCKSVWADHFTRSGGRPVRPPSEGRGLAVHGVRRVLRRRAHPDHRRHRSSTTRRGAARRLPRRS